MGLNSMEMDGASFLSQQGWQGKSKQRCLLMGKILRGQGCSDDVQHTRKVDLELRPHCHGKESQGLECCCPFLLLLDAA